MEFAVAAKDNLAQCDISVGTVIDCSMPLVTPPSSRS